MRCGVPSVMARNASLAMLFFLLIVFCGPHPSLGRADPKVNVTTNSTHDPPSPTPHPKANAESGNNNKTHAPSPSAALPPVPPPLPNTGTGKASGNSTPAAPPVAHRNHQKSDDKGIKKDGQTSSQFNTSENCDSSSVKCEDTDEGLIVACISETASKYVVVIVQNKGNHMVNVKLKESNIGNIEVAEHQNKKINVSVTRSETTELTLNIGKGNCVLHLGTTVPEDGNFFRLPSYEEALTPVNGAYFLIVAVLIFGGTWACCKFRKKRHEGVPYQELEMALPESVSAEVAEGWDQDWGDNWDEDVAVKSPGRPHAGSISANGLTARSSNRDGWENDWND